MTATRPRCTHRGADSTLTATSSSGLEVTLDTAPLDPLGELRATVAGRATYTRHAFSGQLDYRLAPTIRARPAGTRPRQDVLAEHRCTTGDQ